MGKINVQCYVTDADLTPLIIEEKVAEMKFHPAAAGHEKSTGFVPADPTGELFVWHTNIGVMLRVRIETRKPAPKLVAAVTRRKVKDWMERRKAEEIPKREEDDLRDQARSELWNKMDGESRYYWVCITPTAAFTFAKGGALESVNSLVRKTLGTFPVKPLWEGHLFHEALTAFIRAQDERAEQHGIEFTEDLTMKQGGMQVKLVGMDKLQTDAVRQHINVVQQFESVGTFFKERAFASVTPYGGLAFNDLTDMAEHETEQAQYCGDAILAVSQAIEMSGMIDGLCREYDDKSRWVNLP